MKGVDLGLSSAEIVDVIGRAERGSTVLKKGQKCGGNQLAVIPDARAQRALIRQIHKLKLDRCNAILMTLSGVPDR